jgi:hypothetical protein
MLGFKRKGKPQERPEDRRRSARHLVRGPAQLLFGSLPRDCWVSDVSDGGVRLHAEGVDVPDEFTLLLAGRKERRECRVVWRLGHEIGAEFVDTGAQGFASRVAGTMR